MNLSKRIRDIALICVLLISVGGVHAQSEEGKKLIALEKKRFEAMKYKDTLQLSAMLADSLTFIHSSGIVDNKATFIKDIASGRITYIFILPEKVTAVVDGNFAWVYGRANVRFKLASMTVNIDQYVSFVEVYQYKRNQWQLVVCHNARIEANAPYFNATIPQVKSGSVPSIY